MVDIVEVVEDHREGECRVDGIKVVEEEALGIKIKKLSGEGEEDVEIRTSNKICDVKE